MDPAAVSRAVRANREHFDIEAFTPHDLRRTFTSGMAKLGIDRLVVQRLLNPFGPIGDWKTLRSVRPLDRAR